MSSSFPLYFNEWWLESVSGSMNWGIAKVTYPDYAVGYWPWVLKKNRFGIMKLSQPPLTQFLGPYIILNQSNTKHAHSPSRDMQMYNELYRQLPRHHILQQNISPDISSWLPFYWQGFNQTTRYTYRINTSASEPDLWSNIQNSQRRRIKKSFAIGHSVAYSLDPTELYRLNALTFQRQGLTQRLKKQVLYQLCNALAIHNSGQIIYIISDDGYICSAILLAWDDYNCYYVCGGTDPNYRDTAAGSRIIWEAILYSKSISKNFDFEGSMVQPIEKFFRTFGPQSYPYHNLSKYNSRLAEKLFHLKSIF